MYYYYVNSNPNPKRFLTIQREVQEVLANSWIEILHIFVSEKMQKTTRKFYRIMFGLCAIILACILSDSCSTSQKTTATVTPSPEETAWRTACSKCHTLDNANPRGYPASQWPRIVSNMQNKNGGNQFSDKQKDLIIKYLVANAIIKN